MNRNQEMISYIIHDKLMDGGRARSISCVDCVRPTRFSPRVATAATTTIALTVITR